MSTADQQQGSTIPSQTTPPATAPSSGRLRPRTGPIVWGALVLVFCAYVASRSLGGSVDAAAWIITTIIGLGVLLLAVGIAVLVRGSREG